MLRIFTYKALPVLALAFLCAQTMVFADPADDATGQGTLVSRTENRTITTTETRKPNPDGSVSGTFSQFIKGNRTPEKITIKGLVNKVDDKETFTLEETGKTADGVDVVNDVTITRDLVGGVLIEKLTRKSKKKKKGQDEKPELGGLPAFVITTEASDGSKVVKVFNDPTSDPSKDPPSLTFDIPVDKPGGLGIPPLDVFLGTPPPGGITPPVTGGTPPPNLGTDPDVTLPTPPKLPDPPPVIPKLPDPPDTRIKIDETFILKSVG